MIPVGTSAPRILVIEDDPAVGSNLREILELDGYEVFLACDGASGISMAGRIHPDLIISDWMMPRLDGPGVLARVRSDPGLAATPFIFLTALANRDDIRCGMEFGADDYLPKPFAANEVLRAVGSRLDKHNRLQREREEQLAALRQYAVDTECIVDGAGIIRYAGPTTPTVLGAAPEDLIGTDLAARFHPSAEARLRGELRRVLTDPQAEGFLEAGVAHPHRSGMTVEIRFRSLFHDPRIRGILVSIHDITRQKIMEMNLQRMQRMDGIGAIACGVAHDLNNLFSPILLSAHFLRKAITPDQSTAHTILSVMERNASRGSSLVGQLLAFTRGDEQQRQVLNLKHVVTETRQLLRQTLPSTITISAEYPPDLWSVLANPTQMFQVLLNLSVNARDAMPDGGRITVSVSNRPVADRESDVPAGRYVQLVVHDTGTGIPDVIRHRILEPFFTTKEPGKGTGLGLSTVAAIVREYGGILQIDSAPGTGSTFTILLPAIAEAGAGQADAAADTLPPFNGRLLLVDEDPGFRELVRFTIQDFGGTCICASDEHDLRSWEADQWSGVTAALVDCRTPLAAAASVVQTIRTNGPEIRILMTTADPSVDEEECLRIGGRLLRKPFARGQLAEALGGGAFPLPADPHG